MTVRPSGPASPASPVAPVTIARMAKPAAPAAPSVDTVELSPAAQSALHPGAGVGEATFRAAMAFLDPARATAPEVVRVVAERLAAELMGGHDAQGD